MLRGSQIHGNYWDCCCPECGVQFGIPHAYKEHLRTEEKTFWCLNGHQLELSVDTADEKKSGKLEIQFGEIRGENEMLKAQVRAKEQALKDAAEELKILRGIVKQRRTPRANQADKAA